MMTRDLKPQWKTGKRRGISRLRAQGTGHRAQGAELRVKSEAELVPLLGGVRGGLG
jgi:hypothetical protein